MKALCEIRALVAFFQWFCNGVAMALQSSCNEKMTEITKKPCQGEIFKKYNFFERAFRLLQPQCRLLAVLLLGFRRFLERLVGGGDGGRALDADSYIISSSFLSRDVFGFFTFAALASSAALVQVKQTLVVARQARAGRAGFCPGKIRAGRWDISPAQIAPPPASQSSVRSPDNQTESGSW